MKNIEVLCRDSEGNLVCVKEVGNIRAFIIKHITHRRAYRQTMKQFKKGGA